MEKKSVRYAFVTVLALSLAQSDQALAQNMPWQGSQQQQSSAPQQPGVHSINGVPLFIDGTQSPTKPPALSPALLDKVRSVTTLGDALPILGPAYVDPNDSMHIAHWHFQDGSMLTLWPQGGETLSDTVSVSARPDCGVPANQCTDLVLGRKAGAPKQHSHNGGGGGNGGGNSGGGNGGNGGGSGGNSSGLPSVQSLMPLMKMIPGGR